MEVEGPRSRGRPRNNWMVMIENYIWVAGAGVLECHVRRREYVPSQVYLVLPTMWD